MYEYNNLAHKLGQYRSAMFYLARWRSRDLTPTLQPNQPSNPSGGSRSAPPRVGFWQKGTARRKVGLDQPHSRSRAARVHVQGGVAHKASCLEPCRGNGKARTCVEAGNLEIVRTRLTSCVYLTNNYTAVDT